VAQRLGYEQLPLTPAQRALPLLRAGVTLPVGFGRALRANRERIGNVPAYVARRARLALSR